VRTYGFWFLGAVLLSGSASAQFYPAPGPGPRPTSAPMVGSGNASAGADVGIVLKDIREGVRTGQLSHKEAKELRRDAEVITDLENRYAEGGLSDSEEAEILNRILVLKTVTDAKRSGTVK
jgi:hypothetical protein